MNGFVEILTTLIECSTILLSVGLICVTIRPAFQKDEDKK